MRIVSKVDCHPYADVGLRYATPQNDAYFSIDSNRIYAEDGTNDGHPYADLDGTVWHTYRIVVLGSHHQIYVDDVLTLDFQATWDGILAGFYVRRPGRLRV